MRMMRSTIEHRIAPMDSFAMVKLQEYNCSWVLELDVVMSELVRDATWWYNISGGGTVNVFERLWNLFCACFRSERFRWSSAYIVKFACSSEYVAVHQRRTPFEIGKNLWYWFRKPTVELAMYNCYGISSLKPFLKWNKEALWCWRQREIQSKVKSCFFTIGSYIFAAVRLLPRVWL